MSIVPRKGSPLCRSALDRSRFSNCRDLCVLIRGIGVLVCPPLAFVMFDTVRRNQSLALVTVVGDDCANCVKAETSESGLSRVLLDESDPRAPDRGR